MATEKILIFDEAGNAKRMKVRIARFLDNEPVTASDKTNIRTTLDVDGSQSGTFTTPLSVTSASDSSFTGGGNFGIGTASPSAVTEITGAGTGGRGLKITETSASKTSGVYTLEVDSSAHGSNTSAAGAMKIDVAGGRALTVDGAGRVGIGTASPSYDLHATNASTAASIGITGSGGSKDTWTVTSTDTGGKAVLNFRDEDTSTTVLQLHQDNKLVLSSGGGIDFGSGGASSLLDDYERGTGDPTDASGAGLTFAGRAMNYVKIGSQVTVYVTVTFPTTSATSTASIGSFPFAFGSSNVDRIGGVVAYSNYTGTLTVLGVTGTGRVNILNEGTMLTNANLSGKVLYFSITYDVS